MLGGDKLFFSGDAGDVQVWEGRKGREGLTGSPIIREERRPLQAISGYGITLNNNESAIYALTAGLDQE